MNKLSERNSRLNKTARAASFFLTRNIKGRTELGFKLALIGGISSRSAVLRDTLHRNVTFRNRGELCTTASNREVPWQRLVESMYKGGQKSVAILLPGSSRFDSFQPTATRLCE